MVERPRCQPQCFAMIPSPTADFRTSQIFQTQRSRWNWSRKNACQYTADIPLSSIVNMMASMFGLATNLHLSGNAVPFRSGLKLLGNNFGVQNAEVVIFLTTGLIAGHLIRNACRPQHFSEDVRFARMYFWGQKRKTRKSCRLDLDALYIKECWC
jgi:hypothetical protein